MGLGFVDKSSKGLGPDGDDRAASYQMVPLGGQRDLIVQTDKHPCVLGVLDSSKCIMRNFRFFDSDAQLNAGSAHSMRLPPNATIRFSVEGSDVGFTGLSFAEQSEFQITTHMTISVKALKRVTFCFVFLADLIHKNVRGQLEPRFLMGHVGKVFLDQANVELQEFGPMRDVTTLRNLGNPIVASDPRVLDDIEAATTEETFNTVDFVVYCVWNVERARGKTDTLGIAIDRSAGKRYAFIEVGNSFARQVHLLAHEIGHVLNLRHHNQNGLMFPTSAVQSNRLFGGDIEVVNPPAGGFL